MLSEVNATIRTGLMYNVRTCCLETRTGVKAWFASKILSSFKTVLFTQYTGKGNKNRDKEKR